MDDFLLIEDDPAQVSLARLAIEELAIPIQLDWAASAEVAWEKLTSRKQPNEQLPSLILCDVQLPGLTGFQLIEMIRQDPVFALIPIALCSLDRHYKCAATAYEAGANFFLAKPIDYVELLNQMEGLIRFCLWAKKGKDAIRT
ncbi:MAG: response regulator [Bacteroidota bacterium]